MLHNGLQVAKIYTNDIGHHYAQYYLLLAYWNVNTLTLAIYTLIIISPSTLKRKTTISSIPTCHTKYHNANYFVTPNYFLCRQIVSY